MGQYEIRFKTVEDEASEVISKFEAEDDICAIKNFVSFVKNRESANDSKYSLADFRGNVARWVFSNDDDNKIELISCTYLSYYNIETNCTIPINWVEDGVYGVNKGKVAHVMHDYDIPTKKINGRDFIDISSTALSEFFGDVKEVWIANPYNTEFITIMDTKPVEIKIVSGYRIEGHGAATIFDAANEQYKYIMVFGQND